MRAIVGLLSLAVVCMTVLSVVNAVGEYSRTANYGNEMVVRCPDKNKATVKILQAHADVWKLGQENVDIRVNKKVFARVESYFPECMVLVEDLESFVQEAEAQMFPTSVAKEQAWVESVIQESLPDCELGQCDEILSQWEETLQQSNTWFQQYHNFDATRNWYKQLAKTHPDLVKYLPSAGKTVEKRSIPVVHITASKNPNRKKFYMQCQIHAREWIAGAVCMYVVNHLVTKYGKKSDVTYLLNNLEFVMIPIVNPDGMVYSWTTDRLWRKNRNKYPESKCTGVDINRNFKLGFVHKDIFEGSCKEDFGGPDPLSEAETKTIVRVFRNNPPILGSVDWHSYGQLLLRPYGYTNQSSPDNDFMTKVSNEMAKKAFKVHGKFYTAEPSEKLYPCYGVAADWFYSNDASSTNGGYRSASLCIELRDKGSKYGFLLPPNQIIDTGEEVLPALLHYAKSVLEHPLLYTDITKAEQPKFDEQAILAHL